MWSDELACLCVIKIDLLHVLRKSLSFFNSAWAIRIGSFCQNVCFLLLPSDRYFQPNKCVKTAVLRDWAVDTGENPVSHSLCPTHVEFTPCLAWWDVCYPFFGGKKLNGKGNAFCVLIYLTFSNWQWRLVDLSSNTSHSVLYSKVCELTVKRKITCLFIIFVKIIVHVVIHMAKRASVDQSIQPVQEFVFEFLLFVPPF